MNKWLSLQHIILFTFFNGYAVTRYSGERIFSPITIAVADNVRAVVAKGKQKGRHAGRFMKVGDSITASDADDSKQTPNSPFLCQFICPDWTPSSNAWDYVRRLDTHQSTLGPALSYFLADTLANGTTSFNRASLAAVVGWSADMAIAGNPCPLRREIDATQPAFAIIMYGANDAGGYGSMHTVLQQYMTSMHVIVDSCLSEGIVPMLMSTCPRLDKMEVTLAMSHLIRALAQEHQIPFVDYHQAMMPLPNHGLGDDGVHPTGMGYNQYCWFTAEGLKYGYNLRNLLTLQLLGKMKAITAADSASLDPEPTALRGSGTKTDPFIVESLPFVDANGTVESKSQMYYKLVLDRQTKLRTLLTCQFGTHLTVGILDSAFGNISGPADSTVTDRNLDAGPYYVTIGTSGTMYGGYQCALYDRDDDGAPSGIISHDAAVKLHTSVGNMVGTRLYIDNTNRRSGISLLGRMMTRQAPAAGVMIVLDGK